MSKQIRRQNRRASASQIEAYAEIERVNLRSAILSTVIEGSITLSVIGGCIFAVFG